MQETKMIGHILSKDGVNIDPKRVESIRTINLPRNKKEVQSFLGKISFFRKISLNFVQIMKSIIDMLKKDSDIKWKT
jgi:hypothetical protein